MNDKAIELLNKYVELIKKDYCSDCNELNCISNFPNKDIASAIQQLLQENKQLQDKLKKIEKYIEVSKEQITTKYSNEIPKEILLTHINIILNKIKGDD